MTALGMRTRVYCDGKLTKALLAEKLDAGLVLTDHVPNGYSGGDVAYFRQGTAEEIEQCRNQMSVARDRGKEKR